MHSRAAPRTRPGRGDGAKRAVTRELAHYVLERAGWIDSPDDVGLKGHAPRPGNIPEALAGKGDERTSS